MVTIKQEGQSLFINGKEAILDMDNKWICHEVMSGDEIRAFKAHLKAQEG